MNRTHPVGIIQSHAFRFHTDLKVWISLHSTIENTTKTALLSNFHFSGQTLRPHFQIEWLDYFVDDLTLPGEFESVKPSCFNAI